MTRKFGDLSNIEAITEFVERPAVVWDKKLHGLQARIGAKRITWSFFQQHSRKGVRSTTCRRIGFYPGMNYKQAYDAALKIAAAKPMPGRKQAVTLGAAVTEYIDHLKEQSKRRGKTPAWARVVQSYANNHLLPIFGRWSLAELADAPAAVRDWHRDLTISSGPVAANHCGSILAACYKHAARLDRSLPPHNPCSAIKYNTKAVSTAGIPLEL
jgi:hypothetical protein